MPTARQRRDRRHARYGDSGGHCVQELLDFHLCVRTDGVGGNLTHSRRRTGTASVAALTGANSGWVRYDVKSNTAVGEVTLHLHLAFAGGTASTVYLTGAMLALESFLTPLVSGTRAGTSLKYAAPSATVPAAGTFAARFAVVGWSSDQTFVSHYPSIVSAGSGTLAPVNLYFNLADSLRMSVGTNAVKSSLSFVAGSTHTAVGRWDASGVYLSLDGVEGTDGAAPTVGGGISSVAIGTSEHKAGQAGYTLYGSVGPVIYSEECKSAKGGRPQSKQTGGAAFADPGQLVRGFLSR